MSEANKAPEEEYDQTVDEAALIANELIDRLKGYWELQQLQWKASLRRLAFTAGAAVVGALFMAALIAEALWLVLSGLAQALADASNAPQWFGSLSLGLILLLCFATVAAVARRDTEDERLRKALRKFSLEEPAGTALQTDS